MKMRLLSVLLLTVAFPLAAVAQGTSTSPTPGGTSSSDTDNQSTSPTTTGGSTSGDQVTPTPGGTSSSDSGAATSQPGGDANSTMNSTTQSSSATVASGDTFVTIPGSGAWRVSDLQGKTVYSVDGSNIGDINDVLISQNGSVNAVIIGVGGFLGMGEKNVAVNVSALQIAPDQVTGATGPTGTDSAATNSSGASANQAASSDRIVLNVTRDQLEKAPAFKGKGS